MEMRSRARSLSKIPAPEKKRQSRMSSEDLLKGKSGLLFALTHNPADDPALKSSDF